MLAELNREQTLILQKVLNLSLLLEKSQADNAPLSSENAQRLDEIRTLLSGFAHYEELSLKKLAQLPEHFNSTATVAVNLKHFVNLMIPIERLLDRKLRDPDFFPADFETRKQDSSVMNTARRPLYFILDNLRSAFNVGAIFRLADSVGAAEIALCGYTPSPRQEVVKKTALSAEQFVPYRSFEKASAAIQYYQDLGVSVLALETADQAPSLYSHALLGPTAFLLGNERFGLDYGLLTQSNALRKIPMYGRKNSLNVGQAAAIAAFEWSRQNL